MSEDDLQPSGDVCPSADAIQDFWALASRYAGVSNVDAYLGTPWGKAVAPEAWSFAGSPGEASRLLGLVLDRHKTAISTLRAEYDEADEPLPHVGDLSIVLDGVGVPGALIRTADVVVAPFGKITAAQAAAEGEGDGTLETWRTDRRESWLGTRRPVDDDTLVVWERFTVVYPRSPADAPGPLPIVGAR